MTKGQPIRKVNAYRNIYKKQMQELLLFVCYASLGISAFYHLLTSTFLKIYIFTEHIHY